jgi:3-oxoacyl-(acyl-carrier-protein) synthase
MSVPGFDPIKWGVPRKHLKTMTRAVQLGFAAAGAAMEAFPGWREIPPERRGMYVGASPQSGDPEDLAGALATVAQEGPFTLERFARLGIPQIPPLWLVKGLSNNILGYAAAQWDLQGDNGNWCDGRSSSAVALHNAWWAVAEGRVDLALAGGADALVGVDALLGTPGSEGAAFVVFITGKNNALNFKEIKIDAEKLLSYDGMRSWDLGAATSIVRWVQHWLNCKLC